MPQNCAIIHRGVRSSRKDASDLCTPFKRMQRAPHLDHWASNLSMVAVKSQSRCLPLCAAVSFCQSKRHLSDHFRHLFLLPWPSSTRSHIDELQPPIKPCCAPSQSTTCPIIKVSKHPQILPWQPQLCQPSRFANQSANHPEHPSRRPRHFRRASKYQLCQL